MDGYKTALQRIEECKRTRATALDLSGLGLCEVPEELWKLSWLTHLDLGFNKETKGFNRLISLSEDIRHLEALTMLNLSGNRLTALPREIAELKELTSFIVSYNQLISLLGEIEKLQLLTVLDLSGNRLRSLPEGIGQLQVLSFFKLRGNGLINLPEGIEKLQRLTLLDLCGNCLTSLPEGIGQLRALTSLDLGSNCLTSLPEGIGQLRALTSLDLSGNRLLSLPKEIGQLQVLTLLDLSGNCLTSIPKEIDKLQTLTCLNLSHNLLTELPKDIGHLQALTSLILWGNHITNIPDSIGLLAALTLLELSSNSLTNLPKSIGQLASITHLKLGNINISGTSENRLTRLPDDLGQLQLLVSLDISGNHLSQLPEDIGKLAALNVLNLGSNALTSLPDTIGQLKSLSILDLNSNHLSQLPEDIGKLTALNVLNLGSNALTSLPDTIGQLLSLTSLNLKANELTALPYSITNLSRLAKLDLRGNSDLPIPIEFLEDTQNPQTIFDYLHANHRDRPVLLNEAKILVVGEANVGKTTLVSKLLGESVEIAEREPTLGIAIRDDTIVVRDEAVTVQEREVLIHYWDFGGQVIMHNTHRLFLTTRSCYLLVLDATQSEESNKVVAWLKTIHLYAPDMPVILVINKWDKYHLKLDVKSLNNHHPIAKVIETSCVTGEGIEHLRATLRKELKNLKHLSDLIPAKWMEVRQQVGAENKDYIEYSEFEQICAACSVEIGTYGSVAELLHTIGVLFTYRNNSTVQLTHILNPNWVIGGIYPILNDPQLLKGRGFVTDSDIVQILKPKEYPRDKHPFIISMMETFELSYGIESGRYLVPDLLPKVPPPYEWQADGALRFIYQYDFVPLGLFSRFVVRIREEVNPEQIWRTGVILTKRGISYGRVRLDNDSKRIELTIALPVGDSRDRRALLDNLRDRFEELHQVYAGLEVKEFVPIGSAGALVEYRKLCYWAERGLYIQADPDIGDFDVRELLTGISRRTPQYATFEKVMPPNLGERRKWLIDILIREFSSPAQLDKFLYFEGLEAYCTEIHWDASIRDVSREVVRTLERAGVEPNSRKSALGIFLVSLAEKTTGHPNDGVFLRTWAREL